MTTKLARIALFTAAVVGTSQMGWCAEAAALYKSKCASCHGAHGEGKEAVKAPALKGTSLDADQIVQQITKGNSASKPPHKKGISGITEEQAKALADFIKNMK
jgi:mono/diheme cytochrome c family protein